MGENTIKSLLRIENNAEPQKIGFLLLNEFSMIAFASAIEPLRAANRQSNQTLFDWVVASTDSNASTASNGMTGTNRRRNRRIAKLPHGFCLLRCQGARKHQ
jgi:transcriptional regulator GlxA family with amidase domain